MKLLLVLASLVSLASPNNQLVATFSQTTAKPYVTTYSLSYQGDTVLAPSRLGLNLDNRCWEMALGMRTLPQYADWMDPMEWDSVSVTERHEDYNALTIYLSRKPELPVEPSAPMGNARTADRDGLVRSNYRLNIEVRLYNEGLAFRYFFPEHPAAIFHKVIADETTYALPHGTMVYAEQWAQAGFEHIPFEQMTQPVEMPLLCHRGNLWTAILTADVDDWCHSKLSVEDKKDPNDQMVHDPMVHTMMYSPVDLVTYYATPWKIVMAARTPGALLETSVALVDGLNPEPQGDFSWVRPGKIMRETTLTMEGARATIDFCAAHNIQYMLFDWKWYEPCTSHDGDATRIIDRLDMPEVCRYAASKGVGVWLYVNQHALMKQARELFPLLREWGVVGVKSGFVQYASHRWSTWLHDLVRLAAENHLMMNIHDEYRPSGFSRTYPNLLTQEGICGNEEFPDGDHDVRLAYTRMLCGPADYTICYYDRRLRNTHGHQLAASMVYASPLVTLFWYDKPQYYTGEPEISWFEQLPTTWDETRVLGGDPESYILIARRKGDTWFVAALNNGTERDITLDLAALLPTGSAVTYRLYTDDPAVPTKTHIRITDKTLKRLNKRNTRIPLHLLPNGGATLIIE
ncbi:MAG: glycoside hydrolase family 97 catalytic domain-containing protein [Paludibacteraceae bacterium]|nr:glycoside hydrolase family 97 catalytic domain-containing protein [Paludibacteraceae bacterium]